VRFAKYNGAGNDFVMLLDLDGQIELSADFVRTACDRHTGIGADGVIRVAPDAKTGDLFMDHINADGTPGKMCGNGVRCLAAFARDEGATSEENFTVQTRSGPRGVSMLADGRIRVDMGAPAFEPEAIPVQWDGGHALHAKIDVDGETWTLACVSMGNTHAVLFVDDVDVAPVTTLGPKIENHPAFPDRTNVEFIHVVSPDRLEMRVWELGAGETLACGSGACAAAVASRLLKGTAADVTVSLPGGDLSVNWGGTLTERESVFLTGPAAKSFEGDLPQDWVARNGERTAA
jgi:diaminopimelate epimerase